MTDPKCNICQNQRAKCVFFLIKVCHETKTHIDSVNGGVRMRICLDCAARKFDPTIHVGILKKQTHWTMH